MNLRPINVEPTTIASRYGLVIVRNDQEFEIYRRMFPKIPNRFQVWCDARWRRLPDNQLHLYYNAPHRCPGYLVLAYAQAGHHTSLATLRTGLLVLDEIANVKQMAAIVCESTNPKITSRMMNYFGYVRHAHQLKGYHYIKRFITRNQ